MAESYVPIFHDWPEVTKELNAQEKGRLIDAIVEYSRGGDWQEQIKGNERYLFPAFQRQIDRQNEVSKARALAGSKGGSTKQVETTASKTKQTEATASKSAKEEEYKEEKEEDNKSLSNERDSRRFRPPTREEVRAYCQERQNRVDPDKWYDYYSSNGFKVGKNTMRDWKAAVRTWERNEFSKPQNTKNIQPSMSYGEADRGELENMRRMLNKGVGA